MTHVYAAPHGAVYKNQRKEEKDEHLQSKEK